MKISIGSDHAGYILKDFIVDYLKQNQHTITDFGCNSAESVDYPDYAHKVCVDFIHKKSNYGILICGTGIGMSMAANKVAGVRAALCKDVYSAEMTRKHNNANILCLGARNTDPNIITAIVDAFLNTDFEGGRHETRVKKFS
tara:strand:- start:185 stop:610 length:426 start_codon:yes stop_codon:yes gene_type:complete